MQCLTTDLIGQACRIFLLLAYPGGEGEGEGEGEAVIPAAKLPFLALPPGLAMLDLIGADAAVGGCCQVSAAKCGGGKAKLLLRLGCCHYPHLKLKVQHFTNDEGEGEGEGVWLFSVDSHDSFSPTSVVPPRGHPDAEAWMAMQTANRVLKEKIEAAWEEAGLATFNGILRRQLQNPQPQLP